MNSELEQRAEEFQSARHELAELVAGLDDETFNRRPDRKGWSIAECIDHLLTVGWKMVPRLDAAIIEARNRGLLSDGPFEYGALGNWFVRANSADSLPPRRTFKTPRLYRPEPKREWTVPQAVQEFANLQEKFISILHNADGVDLARARAASPVTRLLRLSLGQWLKLLAGHQKRHLWQARQVKKRLAAA
ncbi:MAG: DinB family protein [Gemmatimonadetes bacterium]|uniref:DinB family protein n=1 Tax=Candidatus Kutchimonas denitrificans TaxID=3056748 RepID=A0AAE4ZAJ0_9BACT|nr:DinB family protein [Gemmatimonadota bacterium]NIR76628.1 DinB family protein [Candidatus Kutchimonas denitrificans]NIS03397.1 DinB family protein [Gemmatimonadota bacterium]NIT69258.1 DinB family protein [Gemmatimonadota bacterium]NIU54730.1 hypothetical protein [Gemmatimonadota bacterium]